MKSATKTLPENVGELKQIVRRQQSENELLREKIRLLEALLYSRVSEKILADPRQLSLFQEQAAQLEKPDLEEIEVPRHKRRKGGRRPLPESLPRETVIHDVPDEEKQCDCGSEMTQIGEETSEQLDIVPAKLTVLRHVRPKYACKACEGVESTGPAIRIAPPPAQVIPKSIASAGLLATVLTAKFADALPFYRQEKQFLRLGIELKRATFCRWTKAVAQRCGPLIALLLKEIREGPFLQMDETTLTVLGEKNRSNKTKSYVWVMRGGPPEQPILYFDYRPTRAGKHALDLLGDYQGYVQTDGYAGYDALGTIPGVIHAGCFAHARRKFHEVIKAGPKGHTGSPSAAFQAIAFIKQLYAIEKSLREAYQQSLAFQKQRQEKAQPILDQFKTWLDALSTPPTGLLGKAVSYTQKQWPRLVRYLENPYLTPDTNGIENAIRPLVLGRKNWLFSGHPDGASATTSMFTLLETAKANGWEPYQYLRCLLTLLPHATTEDDYRKLLPNRYPQAR